MNINANPAPVPPFEERFPYDGPGAIPAPDPATLRPQSLVFVTTDAALPQFSENPHVTLTEQEWIASEGGWRPEAGFLALGRWKRRLADVVAHHDQAYAVGPLWDTERIAALRSVMGNYGATGTFNTFDGPWQTPSEHLVDTLLNAVHILTRRGTRIAAITVHVQAATIDADDVRTAFLAQTDGIDLAVRFAHPIIGVMPDRLPMPVDLDGVASAAERAAGGPERSHDGRGRGVTGA